MKSVTQSCCVVSHEMCLCYVAFVRKNIVLPPVASSECMMQFLDTHKSDHDVCQGSCNDNPKVSKNETHT